MYVELISILDIKLEITFSYYPREEKDVGNPFWMVPYVSITSKSVSPMSSSFSTSQVYGQTSIHASDVV